MSKPEKSLDEFLGEELEEQQNEPFVVDDKDKAVWAMHKIAQLQAEINENNAVADRQIQKISDWLDAVNKPHGDSIQYFTDLLEGYHRRLYRDTDGKTKTVKLPHGVLKLRAQQPEWVKNEDDLLSFIKSWATAESYVRVKESVNWSALKSDLEFTDDGTVYTVDGEVLPREVISVIPKGPKFSIEVVE